MQKRKLPLNIQAVCLWRVCQPFCEKTKISIRNSILISLLGISNQMPSPQSKRDLLHFLSLSLCFFHPLSWSLSLAWISWALPDTDQNPPKNFFLPFCFLFKSLVLHHKFSHAYTFVLWWSMSYPFCSSLKLPHILHFPRPFHIHPPTTTTTSSSKWIVLLPSTSFCIFSPCPLCLMWPLGYTASSLSDTVCIPWIRGEWLALQQQMCVRLLSLLCSKVFPLAMRAHWPPLWC